jgi:meso-butanediol dehydrogenase/(S,S)-butanediol dehydrogenase/diacetyl reductase
MLSAPYTTAKAGVLNLTRTVAVEYGRQGIRCNAICPGAVDTPLLALIHQVSPRTPEELAEMHALGRCLEPREIANVALFLASDESSGMTGASLVVDGGLTSGTRITGFPQAGGGTYR